MEMTQFQRDFVRMADSIRDMHKGEMSCDGLECAYCPIKNVCASIRVGKRTLYVEDVIKAVSEWVKEHPVITNEQKYKEDWGCEPKNIGGFYLCPSHFGFEKCTLPFDCSDKNPICEACKQNFWKSEYKPPKAEEEGV